MPKRSNRFPANHPNVVVYSTINRLQALNAAGVDLHNPDMSPDAPGYGYVPVDFSIDVPQSPAKTTMSDQKRRKISTDNNDESPLNNTVDPMLLDIDVIEQCDEFPVAMQPSTDTTAAQGISMYLKNHQKQLGTSKTDQFFNLPQDIAEKIIAYVCARHQSVVPFYRSGTLANYMNSSSDDISHLPNFDITGLLVNKAFTSLYLGVFYSINQFEFSDPRVCLWFFKHIPADTFASLRHVTFVISTGMNSISELESLQEELWLSVLHYITNRHNFKTLNVVLNDWTDLRGFKAWNMDAEYKETLFTARQQLINKMRSLRGFKKVQNKDLEWGTPWVPSTLASRMALEMQQPRVQVQATKKKVGLGALLGICKQKVEDENRERDEIELFGLAELTQTKNHGKFINRY